MRKVYEDLVAAELAEVIDICFDGRTFHFDEEVEIEDYVINVSGSIDYAYTREDDTDAIYITWMQADIKSIEVSKDEDSEAEDIHLNETFVKKYLEQYLMERWK